MEKPQKNHPFFAILLSKVRGSVQFLGGSVGSRFGSQEQTGDLVGSRFGFWRFGRFEVRYFQVRPNTNPRLLNANLIYYIQLWVLTGSNYIFKLVSIIQKVPKIGYTTFPEYHVCIHDSCRIDIFLHNMSRQFVFF